MESVAEVGGGSNVVLTGFMGTGKSAVGRALSAALRREFVDTDRRIVDEHGPIPAIFSDRGEGGFRALERELAESLAEQDGLVIATGGGMLIRSAAAEPLRRTGRIFCLTAEPATIVRRVLADGIDERPLLAGPDPERRVADLLAERASAYAQFEAVPTDGRTVPEVVADIVGRLAGD